MRSILMNTRHDLEKRRQVRATITLRLGAFYHHLKSQLANDAEVFLERVQKQIDMRQTLEPTHPTIAVREQIRR
jgi:hypothetical protein